MRYGRMTDLASLPVFCGRAVQMVIETPRGARAKFTYDTERRLFTFGRPLPAGLVYPYDWGFLPSTLGEDGDPLDGLLIHPGTGCPGLVVECRLLGLLAVVQREKGRKKRNDRFILTPSGQPDGLKAVPPRLRQEIEQFFEASILGTGHSLSFQGWKGPAAARAAIEKGRKAFERKGGAG